MSNTIDQCISEESKGFYIGTRMILPFKCQFIKLIVDNHIYTEFIGNKDIKLNQDPQNTSLYFREAGRLHTFEGSYEKIKMVIADMDADLADRTTHKKVICIIEDNRYVKFRFATKDDLFIE